MARDTYRTCNKAFHRYLETGSREALESFVEASFTTVADAARRLVRDAATAEDVVQTTYLHAIRNSSSFIPGRPVMPWLLGIMRNRVRESRREARPHRSSALQRDLPTPSAVFSAIQRERRELITIAVERMREPYRSVMRLCLLDDRPATEAAEMLGRRPATVRTQLSRGLAELREALPKNLGWLMPGLLDEGAGIRSVAESGIGRRLHDRGRKLVIGRRVMQALVVVLSCAGAIALFLGVVSDSVEVGSSLVLAEAGGVGMGASMTGSPPSGSSAGTTVSEAPSNSPEPDVRGDQPPETSIRVDRRSNLGRLGSLSVPAAYDDKDAPSAHEFAGTSNHIRQQILIAARHLPALRGKELTGLSVRRNTQTFRELVPRRVVSMRIRLSHSPHRDVLDASPVFSHNEGREAVEVFRGTAVFPAGGLLQAPTWDAPGAAHIAFQQPFSYSGGVLCIDVVGRPIEAVTFWSVDAIPDRHDAEAEDLGGACGRYSAEGTSFTSIAHAFGMRVADTGYFASWGDPETWGAFLLGRKLMAQPRNLAVIGAPKCALYLSPDYVRVCAFPLSNAGDGLRGFHFHFPNNEVLLRVEFFVQWINVQHGLPRSMWSNEAGVTTSNVIRIRVASTRSSLGMSLVQWPVMGGEPTSGQVKTSIAPVLRLDYR